LGRSRGGGEEERIMVSISGAAGEGAADRDGARERDGITAVSQMMMSSSSSDSSLWREWEGGDCWGTGGRPCSMLETGIHQPRHVLRTRGKRTHRYKSIPSLILCALVRIKSASITSNQASKYLLSPPNPYRPVASTPSLSPTLPSGLWAP
jgi:hypothetical protein